MDHLDTPPAAAAADRQLDRAWPDHAPALLRFATVLVGGDDAPDIAAPGGPLLHVAAATTPAVHTLIGERQGTTLQLTAEATLDGLLAIVEQLFPAPRDQWSGSPVDNAAGVTPDETMVEENTGSNDCELTDLVISDAFASGGLDDDQALPPSNDSGRRAGVER